MDIETQKFMVHWESANDKDADEAVLGVFEMLLEMPQASCGQSTLDGIPHHAIMTSSKITNLHETCPNLPNNSE